MPTKKKRLASYTKEKRKRYRQKKEISLKESWKKLSIDALKNRWRERCAQSNAIHVSEMEKEKKKEEEEKLRRAKWCEEQLSKIFNTTWK